MKKGSHMPYEHRKKIGLSHLGKPVSLETRKKISLANKGKRNRLGIKHTIEARRKMSLSHMGEKNNRWGICGEKHPNWKGGRDASVWGKLRRTRKSQNGGFHTSGEWETLKAQYNWTCPCCGRSEPLVKLTKDHIVPISRGGSDNIENIQPLCHDCNMKKYTSVIKYDKKKGSI